MIEFTEAVANPETVEESTSSDYKTIYQYDVLDNLKTVTQDTQTRTFEYDSLGRLRSALNPESSGLTTYQYDNNGNLTEKVDARGVTTTFAYDNLNRLSSKTYNDSPQTPSVNYFYDSQSLPSGAPTFSRGSSTGRLVAVTYGTSSSAGTYYGYDAMGRVDKNLQKTGGETYTMAYDYNRAGNLISQTYPTGSIVKQKHDEMGRLAGVKNEATGKYYIGADSTDGNRIQYSAHGAIVKARLANNNELWERTVFNSRFQPTLIALGTSGTDSSKLKLDYTYGVVDQQTLTLDTTKNNGNVESQTITLPQFTLKQSYSYDKLNRLDWAEEKHYVDPNWTQIWKQDFTYDRWGNRTVDVDETVGIPELAFDVEEATNRLLAPDDVELTGGQIGQRKMQYDAAGNLVNDTWSDPVGRAITRTYDAENRMLTAQNTASATTSYSYDGEGRRVKRLHSGITTTFVYNAFEQLVAEYTDTAPEEVAGMSYLTTDHLGTPRVVTRVDGLVISRHDYLPFGEEIVDVGPRNLASSYGSADGVRQQFTSKERDNETGLDYFGARYYASTQGRFTSVDPVKMGIDRLFDPQRINLYAYVRNNPLAFTDPDGRDLVLGSGDQKRVKKALVEIAKRPGGRELLQNLDKLTIQIILSTGDSKGRHYGSIGAQDPSKSEFVRSRDAKGSIVDIKGDPILVTLDFKRAEADRKENEKRTETNKGMAELGLPGRPLIQDVPNSDAQLTGHEIAHGEAQFFQLPNTENAVTGRIDDILAEPVDKNLAKDANKFVDNLVQPNQPQPQPQPTPEIKKRPEDE